MNIRKLIRLLIALAVIVVLAVVVIKLLSGAFSLVSGAFNTVLGIVLVIAMAVIAVWMLCCADCSTFRVTEHDNKISIKMGKGIFDASKLVIIQNVPSNPNNK